MPLKENQGLGKALNEGLRHCSYELVARMDTDDICYPTRFEEEVKYMGENPDTDICGSWISEFSETTDNILNILTIRKYIKDKDVVHVHHFPNQLFTKIAIDLIPKKKRPALITTEHSTFNNRRKYSFLRAVDRWFYRSYDKICCISPQAYDNLNIWLSDSKLTDKIITINNGINIPKYSEAKNNLPEVLENYDSNIFYAVMVACMDYPKDPLTVIKSLDFTPENVHLVFIGDGNLVESMKSEVNNMGISDRVHFLGLRSDVPELLKGCDVGVLSTKWEGFGLVAAEYMAAGLPVLVTNVEGLREVAGDRDSIFEYQDYNDLGEKITRLATDAGYYNEKKEHSSRQAKLFSAETMNKSYLKQYQDILLGICR